MAKEKLLQTKILNDLKSYHDIVSFKIMKASMNGIPDTFFTSRLTGSCMVEIKAEGEVPDLLQSFMIEQLNKCGVKTFICDTWKNWVEIKKILHLSHKTIR